MKQTLTITNNGVVYGTVERIVDDFGHMAYKTSDVVKIVGQKLPNRSCYKTEYQTESVLFKYLNRYERVSPGADAIIAFLIIEVFEMLDQAKKQRRAAQ